MGSTWHSEVAVPDLQIGGGLALADLRAGRAPACR
jgi:hypothetical protein